MNLRDYVYQVRNKLGELTPNLWSDAELIMDINVGAKILCSAAQNLNATENITYEANVQEMPLTTDVDMITYIAYFSGQLFPLAPIAEQQVKFGGFMTGIPYYFYVKTDTLIMSPQVAGGDMQIQNIPTSPNDPQPHTVVGLWPIPAQTTAVHFEYIATHPYVVNPLDPIRVPDRFNHGVVAYAVARAKEKESAFDEADRYDAQHEKIRDAFVAYMVSQKQVAGMPMYGDNVPPIWARGSSSVIMVNQNPTYINE